jgi:hypothetical protein
MGSGDFSAIVTLDWGGQDFGLGVVRTDAIFMAKRSMFTSMI